MAKMSIHWINLHKIIEQKSPKGISKTELAQELLLKPDDKDFVRCIKVLKAQKKVREILGQDSKGHVCLILQTIASLQDQDRSRREMI